MSLVSYRTQFHQRSPRVWYEPNRLYAKTNLWFRILNLFSYSRTVIIQKEMKSVLILIRKFWFLHNSIEIPFHLIYAVDRVRWEVPEGFSLFVGVTDTTEVFYVRLLLKSPHQPIDLFRFYGHGSRLTGWKGILLGNDSLIDFEGIQDEKSLSYAEAVSEFIGVECRA